MNDYSEQIGSQNPSIWELLHELWNKIAHIHPVGDDLDTASSQHIQLVISLAKFTRNLIAEVPSNQKNAFLIEPQLRQLIYLHTSWSMDNNENTFAVTRMLVQTLSNLVSGNQELLHQFWAVHIRVPEEQSILVRLLRSPDLRSIISVLVLLMNCIHNSYERGLALVTTGTGIRVCISILDRLDGLSDLPESGDEGKVFELGYMCALFSKLFQLGFFPETYDRTSVQDEVVSPPQTTLLKLLDSFLQPALYQDGGDHLLNLAGFLAPVFIIQAEHVQRAIQQVIGVPPPDPIVATDVRGNGGTAPQASGGTLDIQLPGVCVALVLLSNSLSSILLAERENESGVNTGPNLVSLSLPHHDTISGSWSSTGTGFVEALLETLRQLDIFLPRINFGKARSPNVHSPNGDNKVPGQSTDVTGFAYLKRDLVRLLGILCHDSKAIQDRVRLCGGIQVVLNLCVIDERNPYLREHALFTLRNLLHNNPENQVVVDGFRADEHV
ncbi:spinocerebellar ataxia type 10 protein domain-containing protein [Multifurca ochricompacta]|uniref:Ataxin-10 homolog n=1 Tax=Multifurca ochricompacta TaxID=376703 RepID=A0AAD4M9S2_9AGAM|nr:spinocerebellar ataxia type 10 protein domain-containing protein [Multifurca ochricompacta]